VERETHAPFALSFSEHWSVLCAAWVSVYSYGSHSITPVAQANALAQFRFRVLLVDDEPSIRETAGQILESEGHEGGQAHNRQLTYRGHIDVVAVLGG
jgi:hypothetical protein